MVAQVKSAWGHIDMGTKIIGALATIVVVLFWVFGMNSQTQANAKDIVELKGKQESYEKTANRIDRRLYRLELVHKIPTEAPDGK